MTSGKYLTTGEAARLLGISRSTVSRKYDQGLIRGKTNPLTGERMISRESVVGFMKQHHLPVNSAAFETRNVLVASADKKVHEAVTSLLADEERISTESVESGADALVTCAQEGWGLLVLDQGLEDVASKDVIASLRRGENTRHLPILACSREEDRGAALGEGADDAVSYPALQSPAVKEKIYSLLGMKEDSEDVPIDYEHKRRWPRVEVNAPATISVYRVGAPKKQEKGTATVIDISCGGARLSNIELPSGSLPIQPFRFMIEIDQEPLKGLSAHCQVLRFQAVGQVTVALQFMKISKEDLQRLVDLIVV